MWRACIIVLLAAAGAGSLAASAEGATRSRHVQYRGYRIAVPAGWPVYDLRSDPTVCVRFNRHAVYLGTPGSTQRCPAHAAGRTEAILVEPVNAHGVIVTASWARHPGTVERALGRRSLPATPPDMGQPTAAAAVAASAVRAGAARRRPVAQPAAIYTGLGFDPCSAPSTSTMTAWSASPYHAVGIYLGGANEACSQPNLTAAWVAQESLAGWHLIPTYVGLQAPSNSCGCQAIVPAKAAVEGTAAAQDAIAQAQALGIGPGSPIYDDMEAFPLSTSNNRAVLRYLAAWTAALHAGGYVSGVYSSSNSGISLMAASVGTSFLQPDDIWVANWNGQQSTSDPNVPSADWASHQRLHQYLGGHDATYGGVTLSIDSDYLDGATAGATLTPTPAPTAAVSPMADGSIQVRAAWVGQTGITAWRFDGGDDPAALTPIASPTKSAVSALLTVHSAFAFFAVQALDSTGQVLGTSAVVATRPHLAIYGRSAFVPGHGLAGLAVGCFTGSPCRLTTTISIGSMMLASTGPESVPAGGGGIVYFKPTPAGRARLAAATRRRLMVRVSERDVSGARVTTTLNLVAFQTQGRAPRRSLTDSPTLKLVGATDFVYRHFIGGILAGCFASTPCRVSTKITAGSRTLASTNPEFLGAHELGYLFFKLTGSGRALLSKSKGNQLGATVSLSEAGTSSAGVGPAVQATGHVVLVSYS